MRTVLLCRDGAAARYLAHHLVGDGLLDAIVVELGGGARRRKLQREWRRTRWWRVPLFAFDLVALAIYGRLWARFLTRRLRGHPAASRYPEGIPRWAFDDANEEACVARLEALGPDLLLVFGTSLLGRDVLSVPRRAALNVHGGIVPAYRNVHSEVWAVLEGDESAVGTSVLHLDEGIDSGAVALQGRVEHATSFFDLRWRNLECSARLTAEAVRLEAAGALPRTVQDGAAPGFWPTPGAGALVRLLLTRVRF
jgi:folate-dependent phosphoribosylglycinamide formyltransferase PurN